MTDDTKDGGGEIPPHVISLEDEKRRRENERAERSAPEEVVAELGQLNAISYDQRRKDEAQARAVVGVPMVAGWAINSVMRPPTNWMFEQPC